MLTPLSQSIRIDDNQLMADDPRDRFTPTERDSLLFARRHESDPHRLSSSRRRPIQAYLCAAMVALITPTVIIVPLAAVFSPSKIRRTLGVSETVTLGFIMAMFVITGYASGRIYYMLIRRQGKLERIECPHCDYNLTGNISGICPECGTPIRPQ